MDYRLEAFGAKGDGKNNDTAAVQSAIDACSAAGGGRVVFEGGKTYRTGTVILKSYVEIHLEMGAVWKGSDTLEDYNGLGLMKEAPKHLDRPTYAACDYNGKPALNFVYANDCDYVAITGFGKIDGNEEIFYGNITPWHIDGYFYPRVPLLFLENVRHLTIQNVTLTGSAFWTTHMVGCRDVLIEGVRILNNLRLANCDGIDPDHCQNVRIANCHIETADDCIVFKNTEQAMEYGPCENITVTGCTLTSTSAAIKFGSESEDLYRNIVIDGCNISRTNRAISIQLRDKGRIEDVIFSNLNIDTRMFSKLHWWGEAEPIAITAVRRKEETNVGIVKNVRFTNINCTGENGILIYGDESVNIEDITFDHVKVHLVKKTDHEKTYHDLRPTIGEGLIKDFMSGLYVRNAKNITLDDFDLTIDEELAAFVGDEISVEKSQNVRVNGEVR